MRVAAEDQFAGPAVGGAGAERARGDLESVARTVVEGGGPAHDAPSARRAAASLASPPLGADERAHAFRQAFNGLLRKDLDWKKIQEIGKGLFEEKEKSLIDRRETPLMNETQLEAARRELAALYERLALVRPMSRERIRLQMQIARVRRRIAALERNRTSRAD